MDQNKSISELSVKQLEEIAQGIYNGEIFTDRHCSAVEIPIVFMPIALMTTEQWDKIITSDAGMIYEYLHAAGPRGINGNPCFFSMKLLTTGQANQVLKMLEDIGAKEKKEVEYG